MDAEGVFFISLGSTIMGFVVGWLGLYFIAREISFTAAEFGGFITAFFGGVCPPGLHHAIGCGYTDSFLVLPDRPPGSAAFL